MADVHYEVDETLKPGRDLMDAMRSLSSAWDKFVRVRGVMEQQKLAATDFSQVAERFGYSGADATEKEANAEASFAEIDSLYGTANAAMQQCLNRHL